MLHLKNWIMHLIKYSVLIFHVALIYSCSDPNEKHIQKIADFTKENAFGAELNYQNVQFNWVDTFFVKERLVELNKAYSAKLNEILKIEFYVKDNFTRGNLFKKEYLSKDRLLELRDWELNVGHPNKGSYSGSSALWVKDGYKDYYDFAFSNRDASTFIFNLCNQIEQTDSLLKVYDNVKEGDLNLLENASWFYKRIDNYESNHKPHQIWDAVNIELDTLNHWEIIIDSLSLLNPNEVIHYKTLNKYKINNPFLNGVEQDLKCYFLFDQHFNVIKSIALDE